MDSASQLTREHTDSIHRLVGHLLERCGDHFDAEMDNFVSAVFNSFKRFCGEPGTPPDELDERRLEDALGRNFLIAQCAILLAFFNEADKLAAGIPSMRLRQLVDQTRSRLQQTQESFFPPAWPARQ